MGVLDRVAGGMIGRTPQHFNNPDLVRQDIGQSIYGASVIAPALLSGGASIPAQVAIGALSGGIGGAADAYANNGDMWNGTASGATIGGALGGIGSILGKLSQPTEEMLMNIARSANHSTNRAFEIGMKMHPNMGTKMLDVANKFDPLIDDALNAGNHDEALNLMIHKQMAREIGETSTKTGSMSEAARRGFLSGPSGGIVK